MITKALYGITDNTLLADGKLLPYVEAALQGGMKLLQYRDKSQDKSRRYKEALALKELCQKYQAQLLINDDMLLAHELEVGVHLGQEDGSVTKARALLGKDALIGVTCHGSLDLAKQANAEGASYVAFGRFFPSQTKPDAEPADIAVLQAAKVLGLPICAIGGITLDNVPLLTEKGAGLIAVINELFAVDSCEAVTQKAKHFVALI